MKINCPVCSRALRSIPKPTQRMNCLLTRKCHKCHSHWEVATTSERRDGKLIDTGYNIKPYMET